MCFEGTEDRQTSLSLNKKDYDTHILRLLNNHTWSDESFDYLKVAIENIKKKVSGPESTLFLRTLFDRQYYKSAMDKALTPEEKYWGAILHRKNEETFDYNLYKQLLRDYVRCDVKKALNLSFAEYLELTMYEKYMVDEFCSEWSQELSKSIKDAEKQSNNRIDKIRSADSIDELIDI